MDKSINSQYQIQIYTITEQLKFNMRWEIYIQTLYCFCYQCLYFEYSNNSLYFTIITWLRKISNTVNDYQNNETKKVGNVGLFFPSIMISSRNIYAAWIDFLTCKISTVVSLILSLSTIKNEIFNVEIPLRCMVRVTESEY